jgi:hypothetical protein
MIKYTWNLVNTSPSVQMKFDEIISVRFVVDKKKMQPDFSLL